LFTADDLFLVALKNTLVFAVISGPIGFISSFFFAWVIHQLKFRNVFALAFYVPSIMSSLAVSVVWLSLFSSNRTGIVNNLLLKLGIIEDAISWTLDPKYIMPLIILISVWMSMGTGFLTSLAGLSNINQDIYEAGKIDGIRNRFQELFLLTIPQMKPQLFFNGIMSIVNSLNVYDLVTQIAGAESPDNCALTLTAHMYDYGFARFELGYASAISVVLMLISVILGQIVRSLFSEKEVRYEEEI
jgi:multiple sugar transport system permease protein